ncbi:hypothetical protein ACNQVK_27470 [Mycobacterium sp. 134]|uniref:hypothetical protein n=1 Tax=Mycobacterium sp. 134 TaxID=3400425 RepID=UPI003AADBC38
MSNIVISKKFHDGMFFVQVNGGDEVEVHPSSWNDPSQRASIIAAELGVEPQPWMGELGDEQRTELETDL